MRYYWLSAFSSLTAMLLSGSNFALPFAPWDDMRVKHTWAAAPVDWEILGHPSAGTTLNLYISLMSDRENALKDTLHDVSNPGNPRYGAYLSRAQVAELVKPHPNTLKLISAWLEHHGIRSSSISTTHGGAWLTISDVLVSQADQLLGASYRLYRKRETNETIIRTVGYALPAVLHAHIQTVTPTTHFASMRVTRQTARRRSFGEARAQAQEMSEALVTSRYYAMKEIVPSFLRWLYGSYSYQTAAEDRNSLGVVGFDEFPLQADLDKFNTELHTDAYAETFEVISLNGAAGPYTRIPGWEANLGIQYAGAVAYPTPLVFYNAGPDGDPFLALLRNLTDDENTPQTISIAYTLGDEHNVPPSQAIPICDLFMQLGARGISVLIGSGSNGVGEGVCKDKSGNDRFLPDFPASCPHVTSVGGTARRGPEVAASLSGGGFSFYFPRPAYQDSAVVKFFQDSEHPNDYAGLFNPGGRGYPDIAAQALDFMFFFEGALTLQNGTNGAVATVAGIVSLLNDYRLSHGEPVLGFLNPWLYGKGRAGLKDVVSGSNPGCETEGFSAGVGWDPVTGLGTPNFQKLLDNLPEPGDAEDYPAEDNNK